nr:carbohydrate-binding domain-containing protein [uncultured Marinifilum sp.]
MKIKTILYLLTLCLVLSTYTSCSRDAEEEELSESYSGEDNTEDSVDSGDGEEYSSDVHDQEEDYIWNSEDVISIVLNGSSISCESDQVDINESVATIKAAGSYSISGSLSDGQIMVDSDDEEIVRLILNGAEINCSNNPAIYIKNAEKAMIVLASGTSNTVSDGASYADEDCNAAIYSEDDLSIYGEGSLVVNGNYNDAITGKDGLIITSGNITVNAVDDGIRGKDYLIIYDGTINITSDGDGLKSDNEEYSTAGYISIAKASIEVNALGDAITAETNVTIYSGNLTLTSGNGSTFSTGTDSSKGIKAGSAIEIIGGNIKVNSADDAIHSDGSIKIQDVTLEISSADDGIHAETDLNIISGYIDISDSYEGIESAEGSITIDNGEIYIVSSDDGINVAAGGGTSGRTKSTSSCALNIYDGLIVVDAGGDGLDSNDDINMSDGTVIVSGSTASSNSALDYDGTYSMSGGLMAATGTKNMAEAPSSSSTQYSVLINFSNTQSAETMIHIVNTNGEEVLSLSPVKAYQSLAFSSPKLEKGESYEIYLGGNYLDGSEENGLYSGGNYIEGSKYTSFTISSNVTNVY